MQNGYCGLTLKPLQALALEQSEILQIISVTTNERAVAGAECNTIIELKPEHHAA
jgi:hypothetical protein